MGRHSDMSMGCGLMKKIDPHSVGIKSRKTTLLAIDAILLGLSKKQEYA